MQTIIAPLLTSLVLLSTAVAGSAVEYPTPQEHFSVLKNFAFHTGEVLPELKVHYRVIGNPQGEPVLILHGTGGSGQAMLGPKFAGELFGPGQGQNSYMMQ